MLKMLPAVFLPVSLLAAAPAAADYRAEPWAYFDENDEIKGEASSEISTAQVASPQILTDRAQVIDRCMANPEIVFGAIDETGVIHPVRCKDYLDAVQRIAPTPSSPLTDGGEHIGETRQPLTPVGAFFCGLLGLSLGGLAPFTDRAKVVYDFAWAVACAIL